MNFTETVVIKTDGMDMVQVTPLKKTIASSS